MDEVKGDFGDWSVGRKEHGRGWRFRFWQYLPGEMSVGWVGWSYGWRLTEKWARRVARQKAERQRRRWSSVTEWQGGN